MAIKKILNVSGVRPVLTDQIVFDSTPTVGSLNAVTSDGVARAIAGGGGTVDQHYDPTSANAQSGTAVAEAMETVAPVANIQSPHDTITITSGDSATNIDCNGFVYKTSYGARQNQASPRDVGAWPLTKTKITYETYGTQNDLTISGGQVVGMGLNNRWEMLLIGDSSKHAPTGNLPSGCYISVECEDLEYAEVLTSADFKPVLGSELTDIGAADASGTYYIAEIHFPANTSGANTFYLYKGCTAEEAPAQTTYFEPLIFSTKSEGRKEVATVDSVLTDVGAGLKAEHGVVSRDDRAASLNIEMLQLATGTTPNAMYFQLSNDRHLDFDAGVWYDVTLELRDQFSRASTATVRVYCDSSAPTTPTSKASSFVCNFLQNADGSIYGTLSDARFASCMLYMYRDGIDEYASMRIVYAVYGAEGGGSGLATSVVTLDMASSSPRMLSKATIVSVQRAVY